MALRRVQQPARRRSVSADRVDPIFGHQREIPLHHPGRGKLVAVLVRPKGSVGDPADIKLLFADKNEFGPHSWAELGSGALGLWRRRQNGYRYTLRRGRLAGVFTAHLLRF